LPDRLRIAVVGTGFGARIQIPGFRLSDRFEVVALVGRDPERVRAAAARHGVPHALTSLEDALALPGLDAVSIATPPLAHAEGAVAAARAGRHVLCEKPMARTLAEAEHMQAAVSAAGVVGLIDHEFRFEPARATLGRLIARGDLGVPRLVTAAATSPLFIDPWRPPPPWWYAAGSGGGWLGASGSHAIDTLRAWLGEYAAVTALVGTLARPPHDLGDEAPADDSFSLLFRMRSGAEGVLQQSAAAWGPRWQAFRVAGSEATAWIDDDNRLWRAGRDGEPARVAPPDDLCLPAVTPPPHAGPFAARELPAFIRQAERFADLIRGTPGALDPAPATFADGVAVQHVMDAAREASRTGTWVTLAD